MQNALRRHALRRHALRRQTLRLGLSLFVVMGMASRASAQHGIVLSGAGVINRTMGGAGTAAPLSASGGLYWNPAVISGLPGSELEFGAEILYAQARLSSALAANTFAPGLPPVGLAGTDRSANGVSLLPTAGLVYQPDDSLMTYGLGFFAAGGFAVNYPASTTNPILTPPLPNGFGLGAVNADLQVMQIVPTAALQITDRLSVGFAPTISLAYLQADPGFLLPPDDANGDGFASFPAANHTRIHWGAGFQVGLYYRTEGGWHFGASYKSPQWFESFRFKSADELGRPRDLKFHFDYPMMYSVGTAYTGLERWTFALDVRYIDYHNTEGFNRVGFGPNGAVTGLGWDGVFVVAVGAQYYITDPLALRIGYSFNTNPIDDAVASFNVASPVILEHTLYLGASYSVTQCFLVSLGYAHAFENSVRGPIVSPFGALPGSSVQSRVWADTFMFGATVKF